MPDLSPTITVLLYSSVAALAAGLGALPQSVQGVPSRVMMGMGNALAAGLMLGVAYALLAEGMEVSALAVAGGGILGLALVRGTHAAVGTADLELNQLDEGTPPGYGSKVLWVQTFHGAYEGVAIGVAMAVSLPFGVSMAIALAVHNIPEGMILTAILAARQVGLLRAAALAVLANVHQILLALATFALLQALPGLLPWALGFAVGSLAYLLLAELLPESYRQAGHTSIALVALVAMGIVVALGGAP